MPIKTPTGRAESPAPAICAWPGCGSAIPAPGRAHITWKKYCSDRCAARARNERYWRKRLGATL